MTAFLAGVMLSILPGLITGWIVWGLVGASMAANSHCRHPHSIPTAITPPAVHVVAAERVMPAPPPPPPVVNVWVAAPQLPQHHYPRPIDLDAIQRELQA
jgi:hypothetical protein